ncbi:MAG: endonuclease Q family protein, partial [Patescibacteria group bacterium]|nr:endonuclease Q family protein [Patescibacteria group bacterium]
MKVIADLHIHSKYSRAVSKQMDLETMALWAEKKGIDLLATGDWTHPVWFKEIESKLEEDGEGIFKVKSSKSKMRYALSCEISNIYTKGGKGRRIHTVFMAPSFKTVRKINKELTKRGGNLLSDGRPILGFSMEEMCEIVWGIDEKVIVMPAHIWTPWFAMFGSKSGFDSVEECFGKYADKIKAIETGLSSDPAMNWKVKDLETRAIVSSSDAHSPRKLGREVTVFDFEKDKYSFSDLAEGLEKGNKKNKIVYTIEFHPEEGKYYYTGHRKCGVVQSPKETSKRGTTCHVCGKPLTVGVMHRVEELASGPSTNLSSQNFNKETPSSLPAQAGFAVPTRHSAGSPVKESPLTSRKGLNL